MSHTGEAMSHQDLLELTRTLQALTTAVNTLNTRLFGNPEGTPGDEGRLTVVERDTKENSARLTAIDRLDLVEMKRRVDVLWDLRWKAIGIIFAGSVVGEVIARIFFK